MNIGVFTTQQKMTLMQRQTPTGLWLGKVTSGHLIKPNDLFRFVALVSNVTSKCFSLPANLWEKVCVDVFPTSQTAKKEFWNWGVLSTYKRIFLILLSSSDQMLTNKTGKNLIFNQSWTCTSAIEASWPNNFSAGSIATAPPTGQVRSCYWSEVRRTKQREQSSP